MKRTILAATLAIFAVSIGQARSQEKEPQASWSSQHRGLIRLSVELRKAVERGDITTEDENQLAAKTCAVLDATTLFLARRFHKDRDFAALADELAQQAREVTVQAGVTHRANDPATCQTRVCGFYWGCFFNSTTSENCSIPANRYYRECLEGVRDPISQPKP